MRKRLDEVMIERGLAETRARARGLILRGHVNISGRVADKAGLMVKPDAEIAISTAAQQYVSFGADKLVKALAEFGPLFDPKDRVALDVGASTGGFTDVLLRHGARKVYAVDVGTGQLHAKLAGDSRVISLEGFDARKLTRDNVPEPIGALVADVSFISLTKALSAAMDLTATGAWLVALIKPQFEAGPDAVGKGGIVRDKEARAAAIRTVETWLSSRPGWRIENLIAWPGLQGRSNEEYLIGAIRYE